jgi:chromodomain-helicase-DNA-binding protein 4
LDDVLRWGTEELFKDEEGDGAGKSTEQNIVWDDNAVDKLLERTEDEAKEDVAAATDEGERKDWANDYLSSFKVATYITKEEEDEQRKEDETEFIREAVQETDPDYWEKLLRPHFEQEQKLEHSHLGKSSSLKYTNLDDEGRELTNFSQIDESSRMDYSPDRASKSLSVKDEEDCDRKEELERFVEERQNVQQQLKPRHRPTIRTFAESDNDETSDYDESGKKKKVKKVHII